MVYCCEPAAGPASDGARFAYKILQKSFEGNEEYVRRSQREIEILRSLDHPNVMPVIDYGTRNGRPWFVMPRASYTLKDQLDRVDGSLGEQVALALMEAVLAGVAHAHEREILHRDIKPANVLIVDDVPVISDFGIAKQLDHDTTALTSSARAMGTHRYMAPEQFADAKSASSPADVYSLGKILGQMLSGRVPEPFQVDVSDVPTRFRVFVAKCCRDNPADRYPDAAVALKHLRRLHDSDESVLPPVDEARRLLEAVAGAISGVEFASALDAFEAHMSAFAHNQVVQRKIVPRIPPEIVNRWADERSGSLQRVIRDFDACLDSSMPFGYCDVVADFAAPLFFRTEDIELMRLLLTRLIVMGYQHNRFHVHDVVCGLLAQVNDHVRTEVALEVIDANPEATRWYAETALEQTLRRSIADSLLQVIRTQVA